jgi:hypothetical protein
VSRVLQSLLLVIAVVALLVPASATASPDAVIRDCASDGQLDRQYSNKDLRGALGDLPSDLDEYSDCREVIGGAIKSGSDKGGGRGDGDARGGSSASPEEAAAAETDKRDLQALQGNYGSDNGHRPSVGIGGETVEPGSNGLFDLASASNTVPLPLLLALIALGLLAVIGGIVALRSRIPALSRIPVLSKLSLPSVALPRLFRR